MSRVPALPLLGLSLAGFLALTACGEEPAPPQRQPPTAKGPKAPDQDAAAGAKAAADEASAAPVRVAPEAPPAPEGARALVAAGHHAAAVAAARAALATSTDAATWRALRYAALGQDGGRSVRDALGEGEPLGGDVAAHHLLRADLAVAAGDAAASLDAAAEAAEADPDAASGAQARAIIAGASVPSELARVRPSEDTTPAVALLRFVSARSAAAAEPWAEKAAAVTGWRADLARAQALAGWGEADAARAAWAEAAEGEDPVGVALANLARGTHALEQGEHTEAAEWAAAGAAAAAGDGDPVTAAAALDLALRAGQAARDLDGPLEAARAARDAAVEISGGALAAELAAALARASLLAGQPADGLQGTRLALAGLPEAEAAEHATSLRALAATAAFTLGDVAALEGMAPADSELEQTPAAPAAAVLAVSRGHLGFAPDLSGLAPIDAALLGLVAEAAHVDEIRRATLLEAAARAADASDLPLLRLRSWLAAETSARSAGDLASAGRMRAALAGMWEDTPAPLTQELSARARLAGEQAPVDGTWGALVAGNAPPADAPALVSGVAAWASARAMASQGDRAGKTYLDALGALPTHRHGRLGIGTALDGSQGLPVARDLTLATELQDDPRGATIALAAHELLHRARDSRGQLAEGRGLLDGLSPADADALAGAAARARAGTTAWLAGGAAPDLAPLVAVEERLADAPAVARLLPRSARSAPDLLQALGGDNTGVLSYVIQGGRLHGVAFSPRGLSITDLGAAAELLKLAERYATTLRDGNRDDALGNRLRERLHDAFGDPVNGVPRFVVAGPAALQHFGFGSLPEEQTALRFLDDIRDTSVVPTLSALDPVAREVQPFAPDLLLLDSPVAPEALAEAEGGEADEGKAKAEPPAAARKAAAKGGKAGGPDSLVETLEAGELLPGEIARNLRVDATGMASGPRRAADAYQGGRRQLAVGTDATLASWEAGAATARTIYIGDVEAGPAGSFLLADGTLHLADLRTTPMQAELVVITAEASPDAQIARARAFLDAGAETVLVEAWPADDVDQDRFYQSFFAGLNQERPVGRAVELARQSVRTSPMRLQRNDTPAVWGGWLVVGRP